MTMITPEQEMARTEELFASVVAHLSDLRREIESLKDKAKSGEDVSLTAVKQTAQQTADAIGRCHKVETLLNECRNRQAGIAKGGYALDLERARAEIGCKLDRLRRCRNPEQVSE